MKIFLSLIIICCSLNAFSASTDDILGFWWSPEQKTKIEISKKDKQYFGKIIAVRPESKDRLDSKNPSESLKKNNILGLELLKNFEYDGDRWVNGTIYDPENGKTYKSIMWFASKNLDTLYIRGYIGFALLGRTAEFKKVTGPAPGTQQEGEPERYYGLPSSVDLIAPSESTK